MVVTLVTTVIVTVEAYSLDTILTADPAVQTSSLIDITSDDA